MTVVNVMGLEELQKALAADTIHLVDVREPHEYAAGHIPGALNMPLSAFVPSDLPKDKPVILSCRSGARTLQGLEMAQAAGRADIHTHFQGSMNAWVGAGLPVEHG
jgi:rhodanese-related sulfurtransferase